MADRLFNYQHPRYATRTVRKLANAWPGTKFTVEPSTISAYAFRYLIIATLPDGKKAPVARIRLGQLIPPTPHRGR